MYLLININQYFATHPCAIIRTFNERWRLCIEYATRSIWRHELIIQTKPIGVLLDVRFGSFLFDVKRFTDLAFEVRLEPLTDDFKIIQTDSMVIFVVGVNQEVGVLVLLVVLYHTLEDSAFRLSNVVGVALWVRTFCMVLCWCSSFVWSLILNFEPSFLVLCI